MQKIVKPGGAALAAASKLTLAVVTSQTTSPRCADMMALKVLMTDSKLP
jgi:hypothetical protein